MAGGQELHADHHDSHPDHRGYRLARCLRGLQALPGWLRLTAHLAPPGLDGDFVVSDRGVRFAGNIRSFIDRQVYLFGHYERETIAAFLALVPADRRGVLLDIGANVGTHTLAFAQAFGTVHAFEPNPRAAEQLKRNVALNGLGTVTVHEIGLGSQAGTFPFYLIAKDNLGLGTFMAVEQYDLPLQQVGAFQIEVGDAVVARLGLTRVDAIKIDVQGLEPAVLAGLEGTLRRHRPFVWFEYDAGTKSTGTVTALVERFIPYPARLYRLEVARSGLRQRVNHVAVIDGDDAPTGNYCVVPLTG